MNCDSWDPYCTGYSIALIIHSLDLFARLVVSGAWEGGISRMNGTGGVERIDGEFRIRSLSTFMSYIAIISLRVGTEICGGQWNIWWRG